MEKRKLSERFFAGFYQGGTPVSAKRKIEHSLQLKAKKFFEDDGTNFWDDGIVENICYLGGGVCGTVLVPIDAVMVVVEDFKKKLKLE